MNEDMKKFFLEVRDKKKVAESYIVLSMYKDIDVFIDSNLNEDNFSIEVWKFYYSLLKECVAKDIKVVDDVVMGITANELGVYKKYEEFGGWSTIEDGLDMVKVENISAYMSSLQKINAILKLIKIGFPINNKEVFDILMAQDVENIKKKFESQLELCFDGIDGNEPIEDLSDDLWKVVEDAHEGIFRGFPYTSNLLNHYTNGMSLGNITMLSANSGVGKTFITVSQVLPSFINSEYGEHKITIIANEEESSKWKQAIIVWVANNKLGKTFEKTRFNTGAFTKDEMQILRESVEWLKDKMKKGSVEFINYSSFSTAKAIATMKKQSKTKGCNYFILDTYKMDATSNSSDQVWLELQQNMVKIYDVTKKPSLNAHLFITYQLGKTAKQKKFLDQSSLGVSRNVVDVVSTLLIARKAFDDEKRRDGEGGIPVYEHGSSIKKFMDYDKEYFVVFADKNRFGNSSEQMVFEVDMARNIMTDFGYTKISQDF